MMTMLPYFSLRRAEGVGRVSRAGATGGVHQHNNCAIDYTDRPHPALRATLPALRAAEGNSEVTP
jgi:hypothetical protein